MKPVNVLLLSVMIFLFSSAYAQDPMKAASNVYHKVLLDNDDVRVMEIEFEVGEAAAKHSHPHHFAYCTQGGQLTITGPDGKEVVKDIKTGEVMWIDATTHSGKNTGTTVIKAIITELKKK